MTRKNTIRTIAIILIAILSFTQTSCFFLPDFFSDFNIGNGTTAFSDMKYERPDIDKIISQTDKIISDAKEEKKSLKAIINELEDVVPEITGFNTMYALCFIHYQIGTDEEFYLKEREYFTEAEPRMQTAIRKLFNTLYHSKYKDDLETQYLGYSFFDAYTNDLLVSDKVEALSKQEAALVLKYEEESADLDFIFDGVKGDFQFHLDRMTDSGRYNELVEAFYEGMNSKLGPIYVDLVKIRMDLAKAAGYDSYADYQFDILGRDYTPFEAEKYTEEISEYIVPLYERLKNDPPEIMNSDAGAVQTSVEDSLRYFMDSVKGLDEHFCDVLDYMDKYGLYYICDSKEGVTISFTTYIQDFNEPFMFVSGSGYLTDLMTLIHEFGHFTDYYYCLGADSNLDLSECFSQGLELLMTDKLIGPDDEQKEMLRSHEIFSMLDILVQQGCFHHFENSVYSLEYNDVTLENINKLAMESTYMFGGSENSYFHKGWVSIPHFYEQGYYVISYCTSADIALQIYAAEQADEGAGFDLYARLISSVSAEDINFIKTVTAAGLKDPFTLGRMETNAKMLEDYYYGTGE